MTTQTAVAAAAGQMRLGGETSVNRMGFGAMRITGPGIWGPPQDRHEALRVLRRVPELGIDFIDTANSYGPDVSEQLIREALHPYDGLVIATKGGLTRSGPGRWTPNGSPDHLIAEAKKSRDKLGVETIALWQLHRIDSKVPRDEQFAAVKALLDDGVIALAGLSQVSVEEIEAARRVFPVASVQNRYNVDDRGSEDVLRHCERQGIAFIPWAPLAGGSMGGAALESVAHRLGATPGQVALAFMLQRSPVMLPIPGTSKVSHLEENARAAELRLGADDIAALETAGQGAGHRAAG